MAIRRDSSRISIAGDRGVVARLPAAADPHVYSGWRRPAANQSGRARRPPPPACARSPGAHRLPMQRSALAKRSQARPRKVAVALLLKPPWQPLSLLLQPGGRTDRPAAWAHHRGSPQAWLRPGPSPRQDLPLHPTAVRPDLRVRHAATQVPAPLPAPRPRFRVARLPQPDYMRAPAASLPTAAKVCQQIARLPFRRQNAATGRRRSRHPPRSSWLA